MASMALSIVLFLFVTFSGAVTDPAEVKVLESFFHSVKNSDLLGWRSGTDPCETHWRFVRCQGSSVVAIQVASLGLSGTLPPNLNQLRNLQTLHFQNNGFTGQLPSLSGLSSLQSVLFNGNDFDTIPGDFFTGLSSLVEIFLDENTKLNATTGWPLPEELMNSRVLQKLSLSHTNVIGTIPEFLGRISSLRILNLAYNRLTGELPASFATSNIMELKVNNQQSLSRLTGSIDVIEGMSSAQVLWLHVNAFSGSIPAGLSRILTLEQLKLDDNMFTGTIPPILTELSGLKSFTVRNNRLRGAIPLFPKAVGFDYSNNDFCQPKPGDACAPEVAALLDFLEDVGYPKVLTDAWTGTKPCGDEKTLPWMGISCALNNVTVLSLPGMQLNGTLSPSLGRLSSLTVLKLNENRLTGLVPKSLTELKYLKEVDLGNNLLSGPVPVFPDTVKVNLQENPLSPIPAIDEPISTGPSSPPESKKSVSDTSLRTPSPATQLKKIFHVSDKVWIAAISGVAGFSFAIVMVLVCVIFRMCKRNHAKEDEAPVDRRRATREVEHRNANALDVNAYRSPTMYFA